MTIEERMDRIEKDLADHLAWHCARNASVAEARQLLKTMESRVETMMADNQKVLGGLREFLNLMKPTDLPPERDRPREPDDRDDEEDE